MIRTGFSLVLKNGRVSHGGRDFFLDHVGHARLIQLRQFFFHGMIQTDDILPPAVAGQRFDVRQYPGLLCDNYLVRLTTIKTKRNFD